MKNPLGRTITLIFSFAGLFHFSPLTARGEDVAPSAAPTTKKAPSLLLAKVWNRSIDPTGWWMSEKFDGLRCYWDGHQLWSRKGKRITAPAYFLAELPNDIALDGELWIGRGKFEETISTALSEKPDDRWQDLRFMVFDAPQAKGTFEQRMKFLQTTIPNERRFVKVVAQTRCRGIEQLLAERDRMVDLGGEGLMIRQPESEYEAKRSPTLLKVKPYDDAEATVIAHEAGKGKYAGKLGALHVRTSDGREFSIGSGLTDAERASPPAVGTVITYRFRGLTAKGLPRFPSFLRIRRD